MAEAPEVLIQQAQSSLAIGDTASAQASLDHLLNNYPKHPQGLLRRGFVRIREGDTEGAIQDWELAVELDPALQRHMDGPEFRPVVEASLQQIKQAISHEPTDVRLQILLGRAYSALGRYAQALGAYTSILRTAPEEIEAGLGCAQVYVRLGQGEQALAVLQKLYELHPDSAELCWRMGRLYVHLNSVVQATRFFERAVTLDPDDWKSNLELGQIFVRQGRHEQATLRFQKCLQIKSDCAAALVGLAECSKELYRFEAAISYYQQAVAVDPRDYKALCQMGSLCIQLGGLDLGVETLLQALEINQQDVEIYSSLAKAYQQKGDLITAARYFAKTVELNPKDYFAAYNLGLIYRSQGQILQAAEAFGSAAELRSNDSQYQYQSSRALLDLGRVEEALEAARKAVALNPHSKESQLLFGRCCLEGERYEQAATAFRQAVHIDAQNVEAHYQLAVALLNLQQIEEARSCFLTVLRLSPQHAPSQLGLGHVARRTGQWQTAADHFRQAIQLDLTLKPAILELVKLYIERNQKESINEFLRQICLSRKGDHRVPAEFLKDWLEALESTQEFQIAEESLDFVLNLHPTSPQAKDNQRLFHDRACEQFLAQGKIEKARYHLEQLERLFPQEPDIADFRHRLQEMLNPPARATSGEPEVPKSRVENQTESLEEPLWAPLDIQPKSTVARPATLRGLAAPPIDEDFFETAAFSEEPKAESPPAEPVPPPTKMGLAPPPMIDDWDETPASGLVPPPMTEMESPLASATLWQPPQISRLALEDIGTGQNPSETSSDLAQHFADFALHLESCGWFKQASLCLAEARTYLPNEPELVEQQARIFGSWSTRLQTEGDSTGAQQLAAWAQSLNETLKSAPNRQENESQEAPAVIEPDSVATVLETEQEEEILPEVPPTETEFSPEAVANDEPVNLEPEPTETAATGENPPPAPGLAVQETPPLVETLSTVVEPEPEIAIVDWMMSFQEPEAEPEVEPEPEEPEEEEPEVTAPFKSSEFEVHLRGDENIDELVPILARYPDESKVRKAVYHCLADDVPALLKVFRELTQEDSGEPYHVLNLARAYAHTGSESLAVLQYRKYVKMEATSEGYRELGEIYERMGKSELASQALRRSAQLAEQEAD